MCRQRPRITSSTLKQPQHEKETKETMQPLIVGRDITSVGAFT
jgi:hypothetical protein